jgi:hypothetical protein
MTRDKFVAVARAVFARMPVFVLLTGLVFAAGSQYAHGYWDALGLPLMDTGTSVYDTLLTGYAGLVLTILPFLHFKYSPTTVVLIVSAAIVIAGVLNRRFDAWLIRRKRRRERAGILRSERMSRNFGRFLRFSKAYERFARISLPQLGLIIAGFSVLVIFNAPIGSAERRGREFAAKQLVQGRSELRAMNDRLVDVALVSFHPAQGTELAIGTPLKCNSERCALLTVNGPLAVAKERLVDQFVQRADLPASCYTEDGIARRIVH